METLSPVNQDEIKERLSSRAAGRSREISLRTALGATAGRLVRQLLTESVTLALLGAIVGVGLAIGGLRVFTHSSLATLPRIDEVGIDGRVLAFTLLVSVASGPLWQAFGLHAYWFMCGVAAMGLALAALAAFDPRQND